MELELVSSRPEQPVFYYDLASPECYLAAERVLHDLPVVPEWQPVLAAALGQGEEPTDRASIERRARELGLQPIRWPRTLPPESRRAMIAATYAKQIGRGVAFSLAAFRQAFAAGADLGSEDTIVIAGAACEMHPAALLKALERSSLDRALADATARARRRGVAGLPAISAGQEVFAGPDVLEQAARAMQQAAVSPAGS